MIAALALASRFVLANWRVFAVIGALAAVVGYHVHAVNAGYDRGYKTAQEDSARAAQKQHDIVQARIDDIDARHTKEMEKAHAEQNILLDDLRNARIRLSVRLARPAAPGVDTGVDHGAQRADIDPADAQAIIAITGQGDDAIRQLTAAQDVIRVLAARAGKPLDATGSGSPP